MAIEAADASAANTRMWPTRATNRGANIEPKQMPTK